MPRPSVQKGPTASVSHSPWSPVPLTRPLPMLPGCAHRGPALPTARSVGRRSSICRTPPASSARRSRFSLPTGECPATCGDCELGEGYVRLSLATSREDLLDGASSLVRFVHHQGETRK